MTVQVGEWKEWARSPITSLFLQELRDAKAEAMSAWAAEAFVGSNLEETVMRNATALGGIRVLTELIMKVEDMMNEDSEMGVGA